MQPTWQINRLDGGFEGYMSVTDEANSRLEYLGTWALHCLPLRSQDCVRHVVAL